MNKFSKLLITVVVVFIFIIVFAAIGGSASDAGRTPGIMGLIAFAALFGALRAIWKKEKTNDNDNSNSSVLQK